MTDDAARWLDPDSDAPEELRWALRCAVQDDPADTERLARLERALGPVLVGAGIGGSIAAASSGWWGSATAKLTMIGAVAAGAGGAAGYTAITHGQEKASAPAAVTVSEARQATAVRAKPRAAPAGSEAHDDAIVAPSELELEPSAPAEPPTKSSPANPARAALPPAPTAPAGARGTEPAPSSLEIEARELARAEALVRSDPTAALRLLSLHAANYPASPLAQERELFAIRALLAAGRRDQARLRARLFLERFPASAHAPKVYLYAEEETP